MDVYLKSLEDEEQLEIFEEYMRQEEKRKRHEKST